MKNIPDELSQLPQLTTLSCGNNQLSTLPDIFKTMPDIQSITLDDNPIEHFPRTLCAIEHEVFIMIKNTPILKGIFTPVLKLQIKNNSEWRIFEDLELGEKSPFYESRENYEELIFHCKHQGIDPNNYEKTQRVTPDITLKSLVKRALSSPYAQDVKLVKNQNDLRDRLTHCEFKNMRLIPCGEKKTPIHIFGCGAPMAYPEQECPQFDKELELYLHNLAFIYNEVDTVIALLDRENNKPYDFTRICAGDLTHQPTKVLSMPIFDFVPPRFEHYLILAEEMSVPLRGKNPKAILIFCGEGEGRTGTLLAATQILDRFKKLDSESRKQLLNVKRNYTPGTFGGTFSHLTKDFKTTPFVGQVVQNIRQLEKENTTKQVGISVETPAQFQTLEILQCMLAISEKLTEKPPISDEEIFEFINMNNFKPETLEEFFQIDYSQPAKEVILTAIKQLHSTLSNS